MKTLEEALDFLAQQENPREYLRSRGFTNRLTRPGELRSGSCPVARYLAAEVGQQCWVSYEHAGLVGEDEVIKTGSHIGMLVVEFDQETTREDKP